MSSLRPEWPGDVPRRAPEPPRDRRSGEHARRAPGAPRDQWSGYEQQPYEQRPYEQRPYEQQQSYYQQQSYEQQPYEQQQLYERSLPRTNPVAIASLLCGITLILDLLGHLGSLLVAIPAFICGGIALWQIYNRGGRGLGMAIAGLGIGLLGILLVIVVQA